MKYFDYCATTPMIPEVLNRYVDVQKNYFGNANSQHRFGLDAKLVVDNAASNILMQLKLDHHQVIFTSGATESNNLFIKGIAQSNPSRRHGIVSMLEHSSVIGPLGYLQQQGFEIDFIDCDKDGRMDISQLKECIREDTAFIILVAVDSETGVVQPINEAAALAKEHNIPIHCDITQGIGKVRLELNDITSISCSAHKLYGPKGVGCLIIDKELELTPLLHGGHSTTIYRSGTPPTGLIAAFETALCLAVTEFSIRHKKVRDIHKYLLQRLAEVKDCVINSNKYSVDYVVNISIIKTNPNDWVDLLSTYGIAISSKSACTGKSNFSKSVFAITHDEDRATSSLRISLSFLTKREDIDYLIDAIKSIQETKHET